MISQLEEIDSHPDELPLVNLDPNDDCIFSKNEQYNHNKKALGLLNSNRINSSLFNNNILNAAESMPMALSS